MITAHVGSMFIGLSISAAAARQSQCDGALIRHQQELLSKEEHHNGFRYSALSRAQIYVVLSRTMEECYHAGRLGGRPIMADPLFYGSNAATNAIMAAENFLDAHKPTLYCKYFNDAHRLYVEVSNDRYPYQGAASFLAVDRKLAREQMNVKPRGNYCRT